MDRRILKTKRDLKEALVALLGEKSFESIRTKEICERAMVSRNTFYNYYADKYALLEDCFSGYEAAFMECFDTKQAASGMRTLEAGVLNLVDTFMDMEESLHFISILSSFDLTAMYYKTMTHILSVYEDKYARFINPEYDLRQLNSFLVLGFWGFMHESPGMSRNEVRERTHTLVRDLLKTPIFC